MWSFSLNYLTNSPQCDFLVTNVHLWIDMKSKVSTPRDIVLKNFTYFYLFMLIYTYYLIHTTIGR